MPQFDLEEYWKLYEFKVPNIFCSSETENYNLTELLQMADKETRNLWDNLSLGYTEPQGSPILRNEIAKQYEKAKDDSIIVTAGAQEGIYLFMQSLLKEGDHVISVASYASLENLPKVLGAELTTVNLAPKEKEWTLDLDLIKREIKKNTKLIVLNFPNNPTGCVIDISTLNEIVYLARKNNIYILSDEVYRFLEIDQNNRLPNIADIYENGVSLNVMTKAYGLGGLRIGWVATQNKKLLDDMVSYKLYTSICNSAPSEILALIALKNKENILNRNRSIMLENMVLLDAFFSKYPHLFKFIRPRGGCMAYVQLLSNKSSAVFAQDLRDRANILVLPSNLFNIPGNYFRIGFGKRTTPVILNKFESFLNEASYV